MQQNSSMADISKFRPWLYRQGAQTNDQPPGGGSKTALQQPEMQPSCTTLQHGTSSVSQIRRMPAHDHFVLCLVARLLACGCECCCRLVAINCLMELVIASAAVAKGFSDYLSSLIWSLDNAGPHLLTHWNGKFTMNSTTATGVVLTIDLVAMAAVLIITMLLVVGVKVSEAL